MAETARKTSVFQRLLGGALSPARLMQGAKTGPIGLEFGEEELHLLQMQRGRQGPVIRAALSLPYSEGRNALLSSPKALRKLLALAYREQPFSGSKVVSCLPADHTRILLLNYQLAEGQGDAEAIVKALEPRLGEHLEGSLMDFLPVRGNPESPERSALVAVAKRETVIGYLEYLRKAGLETLALEIDAAAIHRLIITQSQVDITDNFMIINTSAEKSLLNVVWGRRLVYIREIGFGDRHMVKRISKELDVAPDLARDLLQRMPAADSGPALYETQPGAEVSATITDILRPLIQELAEDITKALVYTSSETRGGSVQDIYLVGRGAGLARTAHMLTGMLTLPVSIFDTLKAYSAPREAALLNTKASSQCTAIVAGMALRGLSHA